MSASESDVSDVLGLGHRCPDQTNYYLVQIHGQMLLTHRVGKKPPRDTEVFMKRIPRDATIQEVFLFASKCGVVYQVRLLMEFSGCNRGYCFISYFEPFEARKAVCVLNSAEIRVGDPVSVKISLDNNKLVIKGVPMGFNLLQIKSELLKVMDFQNLIQMKSKYDGKSNYLLQFASHKEALEARKKHWPNITVFGCHFSIDWAIPDGVKKAKRLYFNNAPLDVNQQDILEAISDYVDVNSIVNLYKKKNSGHFLFKDIDAATKALRILQGKEVFPNYIMKWSLENNLLFQINTEPASILSGTNNNLQMQHGRFSESNSPKGHNNMNTNQPLRWSDPLFENNNTQTQHGRFSESNSPKGHNNMNTNQPLRWSDPLFENNNTQTQHGRFSESNSPKGHNNMNTNQPLRWSDPLFENNNTQTQHGRFSESNSPQNHNSQRQYERFSPQNDNSQRQYGNFSNSNRAQEFSTLHNIGVWCNPEPPSQKNEEERRQVTETGFNLQGYVYRDENSENDPLSKYFNSKL